ncbi:MAG: hypothetical protein MUF21_08085 [Gemmatimonadaceae bacterium]|nr:hypothetical protein [Gemmatimonadaceae bacterium]
MSPNSARLAGIAIVTGLAACAAPRGSANPSPAAVEPGAAVASVTSAASPDTARHAAASHDGSTRPRATDGAVHVAAHGASHAAAPIALTARARAQLDSARRAATPFATPQAARAAGYRPVFGNVPLQGEHWVRSDLVLGETIDLARPPVLMFAPVRGVQTLVGAAYAYVRPAGSAPPALFDGAAAAWHEHPRLAGARGRTLQMLHVWFTDAPDGPFARYNPRLPFLATGLALPADAALADAASDTTTRRLALALASAETPPLLFELLERQATPAVRERVARERAAIRAAIPALATAERLRDDAGRRKATDTIIAHGDALVRALRAAMPARPIAARLVDRTVDEFMGRGHGIEEELEALLP